MGLKKLLNFLFFTLCLKFPNIFSNPGNASEALRAPLVEI